MLCTTLPLVSLTPLSRSAGKPLDIKNGTFPCRERLTASVLGLAPFAILVLHVHVDHCRAAHGGLHVPVEGNRVGPVWFHLNLFYIERGFYSRRVIGEREIDGSTVHTMGAVGNKTLFGCFPLPPSPSDLMRGVSWSLATLSPPLLTLPPPSHPTPLGQFSTVSLYLEDGL
jgi:hypothetical protein